MRQPRILHVASFSGNIGDNASHIGLSAVLGHFFSKVTEDRLEIRRFYKNYSLPDKLYFDDSFVEKANAYDLLIIGGGGFLDYWVPNSATGTTLDISEATFDKLRVPTLICSVGCIPHRKVPEGNEVKFKSFLSHALSKKNVRILLRNDGSQEVLGRIGRFPEIPTVLDSGFFFKVPAKIGCDFLNEQYVAINTTLDQLEMRGKNSKICDKEMVSNELVTYMMSLIRNTNFHIVLLPHIYSDIKAFQLLLEKINDYYIRTKIHIAPYTHGDDGCQLLFSIYKKAAYSVGMRFHANVCNLAMNKPVSGLAVLDRIRYVHDYIGNKAAIVDVSKSFSSILFQATIDNAGKELSNTISSNIQKAKSDSLDIYEKSLSGIGIL